MLALELSTIVASLPVDEELPLPLPLLPLPESPDDEAGPFPSPLWRLACDLVLGMMYLLLFVLTLTRLTSFFRLLGLWIVRVDS